MKYKCFLNYLWGLSIETLYRYFAYSWYIITFFIYNIKQNEHLNTVVASLGQQPRALLLLAGARELPLEPQLLVGDQVLWVH